VRMFINKTMKEELMEEARKKMAEWREIDGPEEETKSLSELVDEAIQDLWAKLDADGGGEIDREEIAAIAEIVGVALDTEQLDELFSEIDVDGGGEVDFDEFNEWLTSGTEIADLVKGEIIKSVTGQETLLQAETKRKLSPKDAMSLLINELFDLVDGDKDGVLTKDELMLLPEHANLAWSVDEKTKACIEILGLDGTKTDKKKFSKWLESDSDMSTRLVQESALAITYRAAVARERKRKQAKGGMFGRFGAKADVDTIKQEAQDLFEKLDSDATGTIPTEFVEQINVLLDISMDDDLAKKQMDPAKTGIIDEDTFVRWYCGNGEAAKLVAAKRKEAELKVVAQEMIDTLHQQGYTEMPTKCLEKLSDYDLTVEQLKKLEKEIPGASHATACHRP
jgi:Ca2+-binding EF-hand superfamily protein